MSTEGNLDDVQEQAPLGNASNTTTLVSALEGLTMENPLTHGCMKPYAVRAMSYENSLANKIKVLSMDHNELLDIGLFLPEIHDDGFEDVSDWTIESTIDAYLSFLTSRAPTPDTVSTPRTRGPARLRFVQVDELETIRLVPQNELFYNRFFKPQAPRCTTQKTRRKPKTEWPKNTIVVSFAILPIKSVSLVWPKSIADCPVPCHWGGAISGLAFEVLDTVASELHDFADPPISRERTRTVLQDVNIGYHLWLLHLETKLLKKRLSKLYRVYIKEAAIQLNDYMAALKSFVEGNQQAGNLSKLSSAKYSFDLRKTYLKERFKQLVVQVEGMMKLATHVAEKEVPYLDKYERTACPTIVGHLPPLIINVCRQMEGGLTKIRDRFMEDYQWFCGKDAPYKIAHREGMNLSPNQLSELVSHLNTLPGKSADKAPPECQMKASYDENMPESHVFLSQRSQEQRPREQ